MAPYATTPQVRKVAPYAPTLQVRKVAPYATMLQVRKVVPYATTSGSPNVENVYSTKYGTRLNTQNEVDIFTVTRWQICQPLIPGFLPRCLYILGRGTTSFYEGALHPVPKMYLQEVKSVQDCRDTHHLQTH